MYHPLKAYFLERVQNETTAPDQIKKRARPNSELAEPEAEIRQRACQRRRRTPRATRDFQNEPIVSRRFARTNSNSPNKPRSNDVRETTQGRTALGQGARARGPSASPNAKRHTINQTTPKEHVAGRGKSEETPSWPCRVCILVCACAGLINRTRIDALLSGHSPQSCHRGKRACHAPYPAVDCCCSAAEQHSARSHAAACASTRSTCSRGTRWLQPVAHDAAFAERASTLVARA